MKFSSARLLPWAIFAYVFVATMFHGDGTFRYDALVYWNTTMAMLGAVVVPSFDWYYDLRGVLTVTVFAPAALATRVLGDGVAGAAVLVQNSLVIAWFAAFLAPRLVSRSGLTNPRARCLAGLLTWAALQGFAPYPLVDLYAALAVLAALPLLVRRDIKGLVLGGALLGFGANVRPAYLPLVVLLLVITVVHSRRSGALAAVGAVGALLPQVVFNYARYAVLSVVPAATPGLVSLQTGYAAFTTRFDTVLVGPGPRQFFCSPSMASSIDGLPESLGELAGTFLTHLPVSLPFVLQKVAASLQWPMSIPYYAASPGFNAVFATAITLISVIGTAFLVFGPLLSRTVRSTLDTWPLLVAAAGVTIATVAGSAAEARFSLVLVLLGIVGVCALADASVPKLQRHWRGLLIAVVVGVLVVVMGRVGLSHPAPPGDVTLEICSRA